MFTPTNEMGVVVWFAQKIQGLDNIEIVDVGVNYPDATLIVNERRVTVEFEFHSRNFVRHGHDPRECDLIICWTDNLSIRNRLPVWELSTIDMAEAEISPISTAEKEASYWECRARKAEWLLSKEKVSKPDGVDRNVVDKMDVVARRERVVAMSESGSLRQEMANELGVSLGTIKNDLSIMNGRPELDA